MRSQGCALPRVVEDELIHHLYRGRPVLEDDRSRGERFESVANWMARTALAFGSGTRLSFASRITPRVPSEPTSASIRLKGSEGLVNSSRL